jgi:hypothetical protein
MIRLSAVDADLKKRFLAEIMLEYRRAIKG